MTGKPNYALTVRASERKIVLSAAEGGGAAPDRPAKSSDGGRGETPIPGPRDFSGVKSLDIAVRVRDLRYSAPDGKVCSISLGVMDAKFRKIEVHKGCLRLPRRLFPSAGLRVGITLRSISFNRVPRRPRWFGIIVYNDDDAKGRALHRSHRHLGRVDPERPQRSGPALQFPPLVPRGRERDR